jgi:hypothetical protein
MDRTLSSMQLRILGPGNLPAPHPILYKIIHEIFSKYIAQSSGSQYKHAYQHSSKILPSEFGGAIPFRKHESQNIFDNNKCK